VSTPEPHSIHKRVLHLYDLVPHIGDLNYIAPNASVVGEVYFDSQVNVWDRAVIRGDLNAVRVHHCTSIREGTCISNVSALPTGLSSHTIIGRPVLSGSFTVIEAGCTLVSCDIGTQCYVGPRSVVLEGAKIEDEAMVGPNSVVPPGRLIPSHQLWAGNPVRYVRDLTKAEIWAIKVMAVTK
jgi:carbonic anhydrase/acetyltransferase-like protein (isoleucine patch superfamily)